MTNTSTGDDVTNADRATWAHAALIYEDARSAERTASVQAARRGNDITDRSAGRHETNDSWSEPIR